MRLLKAIALGLLGAAALGVVVTSPLGAQTAVNLFGTLSTTLNTTRTPQVVAVDSSGNMFVKVNGGTITPDTLCMSSTTQDSYWKEVGANDPGLYTGATACASGTLRLDVNGTRALFAVPVNAPAGTSSALGVAFGGEQTGFFLSGTSNLDFVEAADGALSAFRFNNGGVVLHASNLLQWGSSGVASPDLKLNRGAAGVLEQKNGTNAQEHRTYFTTTGPIYYNFVATAVGPRLGAVGAAMQLNTAQTTPPTCSSNCGTTVPAVLGTDTDMVVTMGSGGAPASAFVVTFNGTWAAAPSCVGAMALATMVVGKLPMAIVTTTTTLTVTTNGTAPSTNDKYMFHCMGVQ